MVRITLLDKFKKKDNQNNEKSLSFRICKYEYTTVGLFYTCYILVSYFCNHWISLDIIVLYYNCHLF